MSIKLSTLSTLKFVVCHLFLLARERDIAASAACHALKETSDGAQEQALSMRNKMWVLLLLLECYLVFGLEAMVQEKEETAIPVAASSPPEGNTTFLGGTTWCVALPGVSQKDLQNALDWACGLGMTNCKAIQAGGECFDPDNLVSHASYAFNTYYQQNGNSDIACNFGGTATVTKRDPSYGKCVFTAASGSVASSGRRRWTKDSSVSMWWKLAWILLLLLYMGR